MADSPADGERAAHALLYGLGPAAFTDRVLVAWTRSRAGAADPGLARFCNVAATLAGTEIFAAGGGLHPPRRAQGAGARRGDPRGGAGVDRSEFPTDAAAIEAIAERVTMNPNSEGRW